jgi:hypothetical protein
VFIIAEVVPIHQAVHGFAERLQVPGGMGSVKRALGSELARHVRAYDGNVEVRLVD